jgi:hypothetical protein
MNTDKTVSCGQQTHSFYLATSPPSCPSISSTHWIERSRWYIYLLWKYTSPGSDHGSWPSPSKLLSVIPAMKWGFQARLFWHWVSLIIGRGVCDAQVASCKARDVWPGTKLLHEHFNANLWKVCIDGAVAACCRELWTAPETSTATYRPYAEHGVCAKRLTEAILVMPRCFLDLWVTRERGERVQRSTAIAVQDKSSGPRHN